jgi:hypothetical protein
MLLNPRRSKEIPGTDAQGNSWAPILHIEYVIIPAVMGNVPTPAMPTPANQMGLGAKLVALLQRAFSDLQRTGDQDEAWRLYCDIHRAIQRIPNPVLRSFFCSMAKLRYVTPGVRLPKSRTPE